MRRATSLYTREALSGSCMTISSPSRSISTKPKLFVEFSRGFVSLNIAESDFIVLAVRLQFIQNRPHRRFAVPAALIPRVDEHLTQIVALQLRLVIIKPHADGEIIRTDQKRPAAPGAVSIRPRQQLRPVGNKRLLRFGNGQFRAPVAGVNIR